jgi:hypothetical protein
MGLDFEVALRNELSVIEGLTGKVYPLNAIEGTKAPFIVYESSDGIQEKTLTGFSPYKDIDINLYIVANSYADMKAYSKSVISILQSFIGRNIGGSSDVYIRDVEYSKVDETYINDLFLYQTIIDATVTI